jgi:hypothetical protein
MEETSAPEAVATDRSGASVGGLSVLISNTAYLSAGAGPTAATAPRDNSGRRTGDGPCRGHPPQEPCSIGFAANRKIMAERLARRELETVQLTNRARHVE